MKKRKTKTKQYEYLENQLRHGNCTIKFVKIDEGIK